LALKKQQKGNKCDAPVFVPFVFPVSCQNAELTELGKKRGLDIETLLTHTGVMQEEDHTQHPTTKRKEYFRSGSS
jgi:hypothetical protein